MIDLPLGIPKGHESSVFVVAVSGGKDSAAAMLALRESGIPFRAVFAHTGWEAPETYAHLDTLRRVLGIAIDVVGFPGGMRAKIRERAGFPARMQRWCTRELKIKPLQEYHETIREFEGVDTVSVLGIRADESESRSRMPVFALEDGQGEWGGYVWRPLLRATVADVIALHRRHSVPMHPHYHAGFGRVGCWPCIYASKEEVRLWAQRDPERVDEIEALERECERLRVERNAETPGRYAHAAASFFQSKQRDHEGVFVPMGVREIVAWSRTSRGGVQLNLIQDEPAGGCYRWGMCEPQETSS